MSAPTSSSSAATANPKSKLATASGLHVDTINRVNARGMPFAPFVTNVDDFINGQSQSSSPSSSSGGEGAQAAGIEAVMRSFEEMSAKYRYMEVSLQNKRKGLEVKIPDIKKTLDVVRFLEERRCKATGESRTVIPKEVNKKVEVEAGASNEGGEESEDADSVDEDVVEEEEEEQIDELADEIDEVEEDDDNENVQAGGEQKTKRRGRPQPPLMSLYELNDTLYTEAEIEENGTVGLWLGANTMLLYPLSEAILLLSSKLQTAKKSLRTTITDLEFLREQVTVMEVNFARVHNWDVKRRRDLKIKQGGGGGGGGAGQVKSLKAQVEDEDEE